MTTIDKVIIKEQYENYRAAQQDMFNQGVNHLGWLNEGVKIPEGHTFERVYSNYTGSMCLYCDIIRRVSYSVDMGD
jgi:hypothetical protein